MARAKRILFVCSGNTCRSPMAAALLRRAAAAYPTLDGLQVESAGTNVCLGAAELAAVQVLRQGWGIDLSEHVPRRVQGLAGRFDHVFAVCSEVLAEMNKCRRDLSAELLGTWASDGANNADVEDPFGRPEEYPACALQLAEMTRRVAEHLAR